MNKKATYFFIELGILALSLALTFIPVFHGNILSSGSRRPLMPFALILLFSLLHAIPYSLIMNKFAAYKALLWSLYVNLLFTGILWNLAWLEHPLWIENDVGSIDLVNVGESLNIGLPIVYKAYGSGVEGRIWDFSNLLIVQSIVFIGAYFSALATIKKLSKVKQPEV